MQYAGLIDHIIATTNVLENPDIAIDIPTLVTFVSLELLRRTELTNVTFGKLKGTVFIYTPPLPFTIPNLISTRPLPFLIPIREFRLSGRP